MTKFLKSLITTFITLFITTTAFSEAHMIEMLNKSGNEMMVYSKKIIKVNVGDTVTWKATTKGHNVEFIRNGTPEGVGKFKSKNLCGVGVVFYLMLSVRAKLKDQGYFDNKIRYPNLGSYLDLLALGTVADVVPLDYNNRILVHNGLNRIRAGKGSIGINALIEASDKSFQDITASDLGYLIGPKLNAAGRLEDMSLGVELLICQDKFKAFELANKLSQLNQSE